MPSTHAWALWLRARDPKTYRCGAGQGGPNAASTVMLSGVVVS